MDASALTIRLSASRGMGDRKVIGHGVVTSSLAGSGTGHNSVTFELFGISVLDNVKYGILEYNIRQKM